MGVTDVTGVDSGDKSDMMLSLGFERTIDYTREDFTTIKAAYDVILDTKTNRSPFKYLLALKHSGVYVTVGGSTGRLIQTLPVGTIIQKFSTKRLKIVGLKPNRDLNKINQLYKAGKIKPVLDGPYTLSEVPRVINYYGQGRHKGKVAIHISEEN